MEGTLIVRIGRDVNWIRTSLLEGLEGTSIGRVKRDVVDDRDVSWKGWKGRRLDPDVVAGRAGRDVNWERIGRVGSGRC